MYFVIHQGFSSIIKVKMEFVINQYLIVVFETLDILLKFEHHH